MLTPKTLLKSIPKITPKYLKVLDKLELRTIQDFLFYFPFRYDDFSKIVPMSQEYVGQTITVEGIVKKNKLARIFRRRMTIAEVVIQDENLPSGIATLSLPHSGIPQGELLKAVWFNQPYILESLKEGTAVRLSGKLEFKSRSFSMVGPAWEKASRETTNTGILVPVYSETKGITSKWIRWQLKPLLEIAKQIEDPLPFEIRKRLNLYDIYTALRQIHFPENKEKLLRAQKRFAFQEMFLVQLKALQVKNDWEHNTSIKIKFDEKLIKEFVDNLPFKLTDAQRKSSFEILKDLEKPKPMNRLLNGDVGSGKTVVAALAALQTINAGYQVALMAPTEILARQHFLTFSELLKNYGFNIALLTNSYREINNFKNSKLEIDLKLKIKNLKLSSEKTNKISRDYLLTEIKNSSIQLLIGTHAIIQPNVKFKNLALVIIDEQHRFGVAQRAALQQEIVPRQSASNPRKSAQQVPHLLTMTATPIPRTLAIALFGSLELSILDEMPKNRKPIITKIIDPMHREKNYEFIRNEIKNGRQVFVIFPLIEESKVLTEVKAATVEHKKLSEIFPEFNIGLLHGKLKSKEKEEVMEKFKNKECQILVSTSVVEVGIDIPNATVMIIEDADRFGLSQLHQFRGRVGRGEYQSYCLLFTGSSGETATNRLKALEETNDGFKIAEKDLALRGPGQFFGTIQSGLPDIAMENLTNIKLIKYSRAEAQNLLNADPQLKKHPLLADALQKFSQKIHLE